MRKSSGAPDRRRSAFRGALLASTFLVGNAAAYADPAGGLDEIVVTAQKRSENLQDVPVSVEALGETKLSQMNVTSFEDYSKLLPSVSYQSTNPGQTQIYMRGITSGQDGAYGGPQPTVGVYVDEIPTTSVQGQLDFHVYDVARVEALSGPQGTLYGASSEAGTLKLVTNKPDTNGFSAGYETEVNNVNHGSFGDIVQGFVNQPLTSNVALRVVAYEEHDSGYIDNTLATRTYPTSGITVNNANAAGKDFNPVTTWGGRAALKIDLNDNWTVLATVMGQEQYIDGINAFDTTLGYLQDNHFTRDTDHDRWYLPSLTVTGKIGDFDLTYAGGLMEHDINQRMDYSDYSYFYDVNLGLGNYVTGPGGKQIPPSMTLVQSNHYEKLSQELRISSPQDQPFRVMAGLFYQYQLNDFTQDFVFPGLDPSLAVTGWQDSWWLSRGERVDRDYAMFANISYDVLSNLTVDGGVRPFRYNNNLREFYGFGLNNAWGAYGNPGQAACGANAKPYADAPCMNFSGVSKADNVIYKGTVSYKITPDKMIYFTASDGYRPGGVNKIPGIAPYGSDFLYNYEVGWKTSWFENRLRWNGDLFYDPWSNVQFPYLGPNAVTAISNAGSALSEGLETDLNWKLDNNFTLSASGSLIDAHLTAPYCGTATVTTCANPWIPNGEQLPVSPYYKGNLTGRYNWQVGSETEAYLQATLLFSGRSWDSMVTAQYEPLYGQTYNIKQLLGAMPAYQEADFSAGLNWGNTDLTLYVQNAFSSHGEVSRYAECSPATCGSETYAVPVRPLMIGLKIGQLF